MVARAGRDVDFYFQGSPILGVREKSLQLNGEPIDITSDEDNGKRKLLSLSAEDKIDIAISGVTKDTRLKSFWFNNPGGSRLAHCSFSYPDGQEVTGEFFIASYSEKEPYNDASTFEASLQSSGTVTYQAYA